MHCIAFSRSRVDYPGPRNRRIVKGKGRKLAFFLLPPRVSLVRATISIRHVIERYNALTVLRSPVSSQSMFRLNAKEASVLKDERNANESNKDQFIFFHTTPVSSKQLLNIFPFIFFLLLFTQES